MGTALWLVPKPYSVFHESVSALIISLQTLFDDAPEFEPHITITSGIVLNSQSEVGLILNSALAAINSISQINQQKQQQQQQKQQQQQQQQQHNTDSDNAIANGESLKEDLEPNSEKRQDSSKTSGQSSEQSSEKQPQQLEPLAELESIASGSVFSPQLDRDHPDQLVYFDRLAFGRKYFQKVFFVACPSPGLVSFARIIRELFVELPSLRRRFQQQERQKLEAALHRSDTKSKRSRSISRSVSVRSNNSGSNEHGDATLTSNTAGSSSNTSLQAADIPSLAVRAAEQWSLNEFRPHLSLAYSSTYTINSALVRTIRTRVEDLLNVIIDHDNRLIDDNANLAWPAGGSLKLVQCEGPVADWKVLGAVDYRLN